MSTIGGTSSVGVERVLTPIQPVKTPVETAKQPVPPYVHNAREMKQAEIQGKKVSIGEEHLIMAIERANKALQGGYTSFEFSIHEGTKEIMVKVLDRDTGELIREIPSEKILDMVAKLWEMSGVLVDERR
jgi:flagellar protein FlaG